MVTLMSNHQGLDRARRAVPSAFAVSHTGGNWRGGSVAPVFGGSTGLFTDACTADVNPVAGTQVRTAQTIERPARHLGTRST